MVFCLQLLTFQKAGAKQIINSNKISYYNNNFEEHESGYSKHSEIINEYVHASAYMKEIMAYQIRS